MQSCSLLSLATAVPTHVVEQAEAKAVARRAFGGRPALFDRLAGVFDNAGIASAEQRRERMIHARGGVGGKRRSGGSARTGRL